MNIQDKIEEIRSKPEHIRLRYAYLLTAISAILIIAIWVVSLSGRESEESDSGLEEGAGGIMDSISEQTESFSEAALDVKGAMEEVKNMQEELK